MSKFDYGKAEADLYDSGCPYSEEIYEYQTDRGRDDFMRENGLNPSKYYENEHSNDNSNNGGGCYLTTACVISKGLPDDCFELQTLRHFRDTYLKNRPNGNEDIAEYYETAPKVVSAINASRNAHDIWDKVYFELIEPCIAFISKGEFEKAYEKYKLYAKQLENDYLHK